MVDRKKIDAWIKEVEIRPSSAPIILTYIANRLDELTARNEELLTDNIALQSEKRVAEYEKKIAYLEYEVELLKRQIDATIEDEKAESRVSTDFQDLREIILNGYIYHADGRVIKYDFPISAIQENKKILEINGLTGSEIDTTRLLTTNNQDELLFIFSSGRLEVTRADQISPVYSFRMVEENRTPKEINWESIFKPLEPRGGESLVCISSFSALPLSDFFFINSRRGYSKKVNTAMAGSIIENHYIGVGVKSKPDRIFNVDLIRDEDHLIMISSQGYMLAIDSKLIPISLEEVIKLGNFDHLVASMIMRPGESIITMTNLGKIVHITEERIKMASVLRTSGQSLYSAQRRAQGVRVIGAVSVRDDDWICVFARDGGLSFHSVTELTGTGRLPEGIEPLAISKLAVSPRKN